MAAVRKSRNWLVIFYVCLWLACVASAQTDLSSTVFKFTKDIYNATISENSPIKTYIQPQEKMGIYVADPDIVISYSIIDGDDRLFKAVGNLVGDFFFLRIRTAPCRSSRESNCRSTVLNREVEDMYRLTVDATVRGKKGPYLQARTQVVVNVVDINDLRPLFEQSRYTVSVAEDTSVRSSIARVFATDADIGTNGDVYYSFQQPTQTFAIHPSSGVVTLTRPVKFLQQNEYKLTVWAQDRSLTTIPGHISYSTAMMTIQIFQVNQYEPEITEVHHAQIGEPGTIGQVYAIISVTDKDYGLNGEIDFVQIINGDPQNYLSVEQRSNANEYIVKLVKSLDRNSSPGFNLTLMAADRGSPAKTSVKVIEVRLIDRNSQAPVFTQDNYAVSVSEVAPMYTLLVGVSATGSDVRGRAVIAYSILAGNENQVFDINPDTGFVFIGKELDRERKSVYTLTVSATDMGIPTSKKKKVPTATLR